MYKINYLNVKVDRDYKLLINKVKNSVKQNGNGAAGNEEFNLHC